MAVTFTILIALLAVGWCAWNFIPSIREKMRGKSTIIEGILATVITYFGIFTSALQEAQAAGYIPEGFMDYLPAIFLVWTFVKRWQTDRPMGG